MPVFKGVLPKVEPDREKSSSPSLEPEKKRVKSPFSHSCLQRPIVSDSFHIAAVLVGPLRTSSQKALSSDLNLYGYRRFSQQLAFFP